MRRRAFVSSAVLGGGLLYANPQWVSGVVGAARIAADPSIRLARAEERHGSWVWSDLRTCGRNGCAPPRRVAVSLQAFGFAAAGRSAEIDVLLDTVAGTAPVRLACHQPGTASPCSKPFSFDIDSGAIAGFRVGARATLTEPAARVEIHFAGMPLSSGRYLLLASLDRELLDTDNVLMAADPEMISMEAQPETLSVTWLSFSVGAVHA